ncbi:MAG: MFS transporter [Bdellovibrionales bacterium]
MRNAKLIISFNFLWMFIPVISILVPFMTSLGISMTDFFLLQSFFGVVVVVMEVPSGYVADLFGRKKALVIGALMSGLSFIALYFATKLWHLYIHEFFIAVSISLISGADYALLFDSIKDKIKETDRSVQAKWTSRFMAASFIGEAFAALIGGALSFFSMSYVLLATLIVGWFPLVVSFFLEEVKVQKMDKKAHKENFRVVLKHLFMDSSFLRLLVVNFVIWSLSTMCVVWLIQKYWEENNLPLMWFGVLWAGYSVVGAVSNYFSHGLENRLGTKVLLIICALFVAVSYLVIPHVGFVVGTLVISLFYVARGVFQPLFKEGFNHRLKEEFRATANSIYSLVFRLAFVVIGPLLGLYVDNFELLGLFTLLGTVFLGFAVFVLLPFLNMEEV